MLRISPLVNKISLESNPIHPGSQYSMEDGRNRRKTQVNLCASPFAIPLLQANGLSDQLHPDGLTLRSASAHPRALSGGT